MAEFTFRKATVSDVLGIYYVMKQVGYVDYVYGGQSPENIIEDIKSKFSLPQRDVFVCSIECDNGENCHNGERIIGYCIIGSYQLYGDKPNYPQNIEKEGYAYNAGIGIDPEYQDKKIGKAFMADVIHKIKKKYCGLYASVSEKNIGSLKFHESLGFRRAAEFTDPERKEKARSVLFVMKF
jgi:ribosomal protein S18 acetylase RimI-like enzyme